MFIKKALDFTNFVIAGEPTGEEIAKHLVLKTFAELSPIALYIAELTDDGYLSPIAGFGFEKVALATWGRFPLSMHIPISESVRSDSCILIESVEEFFRRYPIVKEMENVGIDWTSAIAWPMLPFGVGFAVFDKGVSIDPEFESFLRLIGSITSLHLEHSHSLKVVPEFRRGKAAKNGAKDLTSRQKVIYEFLAKGSTNNEISQQIGYSESLVRQETIEIYRILGVSGRKELILSAGQ